MTFHFSGVENAKNPLKAAEIRRFQRVVVKYKEVETPRSERRSVWMTR